MINWQVVTCPHCGDTIVIDVDANLFSLKHLRAWRLPDEPLDRGEVERSYYCAMCQTKFFAVLGEKHGSATAG